MQSVSSRIWTHVAVFISYDNNQYTTGIFRLVSSLDVLNLYLCTKSWLQLEISAFAEAENKVRLFTYSAHRYE